MSRITQAEVLTPEGYAEKILDCPEYIQGSVAKEYLGTRDKLKAAFDDGRIAIEWGFSPKIWWRFCEKRVGGSIG